jgi:hypothetical protein
MNRNRRFTVKFPSSSIRQVDGKRLKMTCDVVGGRRSERTQQLSRKCRENLQRDFKMAASTVILILFEYWEKIEDLGFINERDAKYGELDNPARWSARRDERSRLRPGLNCDNEH